MTRIFPTTQSHYLLAAILGAIAGLTSTPHHTNEAALSAVAAMALILVLSRFRQSAPATLSLCSLLRFACTRLTICLVS